MADETTTDPTPPAAPAPTVAAKKAATSTPQAGPWLWVRAPEGTPGDAWQFWGCLEPVQIVQLHESQVAGDGRLVPLSQEEVAALVPDPATAAGRNPLSW